MKQIVFIQPIPLTRIKEKQFYIQEFIRHGFQVQFWNLAPFMFPQLRLTDEIRPDYHVEVRSYDEFLQLLNKVDVHRTIFIADLDEGWSNRKLLLALKQKRCFLTRIYIHTAIGCCQFTIWQTVKYILKSNKILALKYAIRGFQYKGLLLRHGIWGNPYSIFASSGNNPHINLHINHYDWEQFKLSKSEPALVPDRYAVFVDQYFPFHPEYRKMEANTRIDDDLAQRYHQRLNSFFSYIEQQYDISVVIAAHPQAKYDEHTFDGRTVIRLQTSNLICHAQLVLMHGSASIGYAIMADKPLILLTTDDYEAFPHPAKHLRVLSRILDLPLYNLDRVSYKKIHETLIPSKRRWEYLYHYMTSPGIEQLSTKDVLIEAYTTMFERNLHH